MTYMICYDEQSLYYCGETNWLIPIPFGVDVATFNTEEDMKEWITKWEEEHEQDED